MVVEGGWVRVLAAVWAIWSCEDNIRYMESPSVVRCMLDLGAPEVVVLATTNTKARPTIVRRSGKSWRVASPPPSLAANSAVRRPRSFSPELNCRRHRVGAIEGS